MPLGWRMGRAASRREGHCPTRLHDLLFAFDLDEYNLNGSMKN